MDRARFREQVLRRTIALSLRRMTTVKDGDLAGIDWDARQQDCLLLKVMCDSWLIFRDVAGNKAYAQEVFGKLQAVGSYQFSKPNPLGSSQGKVYDGRVLAGLGTSSPSANGTREK